MTAPAAIEVTTLRLPHGIDLVCRMAGPRDAPPVLLLHGFPEAAFIWDAVMEPLASRWRCIAPNLRGYAGSTAPGEVEAYRARHLVADLEALAANVAGASGRVAAVVAHDWGGAVAWNFAALRPERLECLVIVNSPHPALFLRALRDDPAQQAASAYMNFLCRPDAAALLQADDYRRLWGFFTGMGAGDPSRPGGGWLTPAMRERYRQAWRCGLEGPLNYYRASPLRPADEQQQLIRTVTLPDSMTHVAVPTQVLWGLADSALPASLLDGLEAYVPQLQVERLEGATHWVIHEQPQRLAERIDAFLRPAQTST